MAQTARDIMQTHIVTLGPSDPLASVQRLFFEEEIHGAPVVDDEGRVLGILTSMDLIRAAAEQNESGRAGPAATDYLAELLETSDWAAELESDFGGQTAADVMTPDPISIGPDASVPDVARALCDHRVHRVLVVENSQLRGIISSFDLVALLAGSA